MLESMQQVSMLCGIQRLADLSSNDFVDENLHALQHVRMNRNRSVGHNKVAVVLCKTLILLCQLDITKSTFCPALQRLNPLLLLLYTLLADNMLNLSLNSTTTDNNRAYY